MVILCRTWYLSWCINVSTFEWHRSDIFSHRQIRCWYFRITFNTFNSHATEYARSKWGYFRINSEPLRTRAEWRGCEIKCISCQPADCNWLQSILLAYTDKPNCSIFLCLSKKPENLPDPQRKIILFGYLGFTLWSLLVMWSSHVIETTWPLLNPFRIGGGGNLEN